MFVYEQPIEDYYRILGLNYPSHPEEIKKAYREKAKINHPDRCQGDESEAEALFAKINFAYQVLKSPAEKENYDFWYVKYVLDEPYLNPQDDCGGSCGCGPKWKPETMNPPKRRILYSLTALLVLAMILRFVTKGALI